MNTALKHSQSIPSDPNDLIGLLQSNTIEHTEHLQQIVAQLEKLDALNDAMVSEFLRNAINHGNIAHVRFWMTQAQSPTIYGMLCLHQHKFEMFNILLEDGNNQNHFLDACLASISSHNNPQAVEFLLAKGADPSYRHNLALREAIEAGTESVNRLLEFFDPTHYGSLVLCTAITQKKFDGVERIVQLGVNPLDDDGIAMERALSFNNCELMALVLHCIDSIPPQIIETALYYKTDPKILNMLLDTCNLDDVRTYTYQHCPPALIAVFDHLCAQRQKEVLENSVMAPTIIRARKI